MKFYARKKELALLNQLYAQVDNSAIMTVINGRRRIGKTLLSLKYAKGKKHIYLFISKKSEPLLCWEFWEIIKENFDVPTVGEIREFRKIFQLLLELAVKEKIILIIDEFQEFYNINPSVYSDVQNLWDQYKYKSRVHALFIGSIYSLMIKIFQNQKEPLFGRADRIIYLKPFSPLTLMKILKDHGLSDIHSLLVNYVITGGIPRYQEILVKNKALSKEKILELYFREDSPFIEEGKTILIEEFGKEYGTYFSVLELLSQGRTSRSEIESILEKNIGGYLEKLQRDYDIVSKRNPLGAKETGRVQKYYIKDNFLNFWFRFVYKYRSSIEEGNFKYIKKIINRDFSVYSGLYLEKIYLELFRLSGDFNLTGNYWERGNKNEIDLVAVDDFEKRMVLAEIKLNKDKIKLNELKAKPGKLLNKFKNYKVKYLALSLSDLGAYIEMVSQNRLNRIWEVQE